jgi:hypothetical protein
MVDRNEDYASSANENPLDMELTGLNPALPMFKTGIIGEFKIVKASSSPNDAKTLKLELESVEDLDADVEGIQRKAGSKLFANVNTVATGKSDPRTFAKGPTGMIAFANSTGKKLKVSNLQNNVDQLQGLIIKVRVGLEPEGTGKDGVFRNARNKVAEFCTKTVNA